jgi:hypothetical protein
MIARAIALLATIALTGGGTAFAADPPAGPQDFSAADQYVESVPSTTGAKPGGPAGSGKPLASSIRSRLGTGDSATKLNAIATSGQLGAPQHKLRSKRPHSSDSVPTAAVSALGNGGGGTLVWLLVAVAVITALAVGKVGHRFHRNKNTPGRP